MGEDDYLALAAGAIRAAGPDRLRPAQLGAPEGRTLRGTAEGAAIRGPPQFAADNVFTPAAREPRDHFVHRFQSEEAEEIA